MDILAKIVEVLNVTERDITRILDEAPVVEHGVGEEGNSAGKIFEILDFFYANKHLYTKLQHKDMA